MTVKETALPSRETSRGDLGPSASPARHSELHQLVPGIPQCPPCQRCVVLSPDSHRVTSPGFTLPASISPFFVPWHQLSPTYRARTPGNLCLGTTSCSR